jgi:hypothetical protein
LEGDKKYKLFIHLRKNGSFRRGKNAFGSNEKRDWGRKKKELLTHYQGKRGWKGK